MTVCSYTSQPIFFSESSDGGWNRFGWQWRSSGEAVQVSPMYSKADAKVVTIDHPNIRAHTSKGLWNSHSSNQADRSSTSIQSGKRRRGINIPMTRSLWFLEDQVPSFTDKEPICDGKLAGLVSLFLLIVLFNLGRKEVLHSTWTETRSTKAEGCVSALWHVKCLDGQGKVVKLTRS